jgi:predicted permease
MLSSIVRDLTEALRSLLARPGYLAACVLTLGLGLGANLAILAMLNSVLLNPWPTPNLDRIVQVWTASQHRQGDAGLSVLEYDERREAESIEAMALSHRVGLNFTGAEQAERIEARRTTASLFQVLGVQPALGTLWPSADEVAGRDHVLVISHALWQSRFGGDARVIGRSVRVDGEPWTIVGVMPEGFYYPGPSTQAYVPFAFDAEELREDARGRVYASAIALLKPGRSADDLKNELAAAFAQRAQSTPSIAADIERNGARVEVKGVLAYQFDRIGGIMLVAQFAVLMVLLVAIANLTGLTLSNWLAQRRAYAVRAALGASRLRLMLKVFAEAVWLAGFGVLAALAIGRAALSGLRALMGPVATRMPEFGIDGGVVAVTLALALGGASLATLAPALASARLTRTAELRAQGAGGDAPAAGRLRNLLVAAQMAFAMMLVCAAMLLGRSMYDVFATPAGLDSSQVLSAQLSLPKTRYDNPEKLAAVQARLQAELAAQPGVAALALTDILPYSNSDRSSSYAIRGREEGEGATPSAHVRVVSADWFAALRTPLQRGRLFASTDGLGSTPVALVDQRFVEREFSGGDPIGAQIEGFTDTPLTIVGVVGDVRLLSRDSDPSMPAIYLAQSQQPTAGLGLVVRSRGDASALAAGVRAAAGRVDPDIAVFDVLTLDERIDANLAGRRGMNITLATFAVCALLLTAVGLFGTLALNVSQRTAEIGVRIALGADVAEVRRMMVWRGLRVALIGIGLGLVAALGLMQLMAGAIADLRTDDPTSYLAAALVLTITAVLASVVPARRAGRIEPVQALRGD